jgi:hypothetical protein
LIRIEVKRPPRWRNAPRRAGRPAMDVPIAVSCGLTWTNGNGAVVA